MNPTRLLSAIALTVFAFSGLLASSSGARAEDLVDFLWGGNEEFGGGRQVTSFDPQYKPGQIIVSFSDRRLYLITERGKAITYPVAVPAGDARWQGVTFVSDKKINPAWTPTPEMVRQNPRLPRWVPGGHPMNPLGIRAMYLGTSAYRIHGTDAPWTIGQAVSHGCIRMTNEDVLDLYPRVPVGMRVTVTWQQFSSHPMASNEPPVFGGDSGYPSRASQASYSNNGNFGASDDESDRSQYAPRREPGLATSDQEGRGEYSESPKKKVAREASPKKSASKASEDDKPAITKTSAGREEASSVSKPSAKSEEKQGAAKVSAKETDKPVAKPAAQAEKPAAKPSHEAKAAKAYAPVADPVAVKKTSAPAGSEKSSEKAQKSAKTALAD
jgi:hypothetical protein